MKKMFALTLCAMLLLLSVSALAAGELTVKENMVMLYPGKTSGYFVAKVENTGDAPTYYGDSNLVIFSKDNDILATEKYLSPVLSHIMLAPGEYTYVLKDLWGDELKGAVVGDVKFSVKPDDTGVEALSVANEAKLNIVKGKSYGHTMDVTLTNSTESAMDELSIICVVRDAEGNLLYSCRRTIDDILLHPGSTVTVKIYVDSDFVEYCRTNSITPASAEALIYTSKK